MTPTRRKFGLQFLALGAGAGLRTGLASAEEVTWDCGCCAAYIHGISARVFPPSGSIVLFGGGSGEWEVSTFPEGVPRFELHGDDGSVFQTLTEAFPNLPFPRAQWPVRHYRLRPEAALSPGVRYTIVLREAGGPVPFLGTNFTRFDVRAGWDRPPPEAPRVLRLELIESVPGSCSKGRRQVGIELGPGPAWSPRDQRRWWPLRRVFEVWVVRRPGRIDYSTQPQFLKTDQTDWVLLDQSSILDPFDAFLPRYAATVGIREVDASGARGPPFEFVIPDASDVVEPGDTRWLPFGS